MSYDAGAITGSVSLDLSPMKGALTAGKAELGRFKAATERAFSGIDRSRVLSQAGSKLKASFAQMKKGVGTLDAGQFFKGLSGSGNALAGVGGAMGRGLLSGIGGALKGGVGMVMGWAKMLFSPLIAGIAALVGVGATLAGFRRTMDSIEDSARIAGSVGMSVTAFSALEHAAYQADVSTGELGDALKKMQNNLADAAGGTGEAKASFEQLGLSVTDLAADSPEVALGKIGDAINGVGNSAQQTQAVMNIFGQSAGPAFRELLAEGSAGLKASMEEAKRFDKVLNDTDAAKVRQANDAFKNVANVIQGALKAAVVELAPHITKVVTGFVDAGTAAGGFGTKVVGALRGVAGAIAKVADYLELAKAAFYMLKIAAAGNLLQIIAPLTLVIKGIEWLYNKTTGSSTHFADTFVELTKNLGNTAKESFDKAGESWQRFLDGANSKDVAQWFDDANAKAMALAEASTKAGDRTAAAFKQIGATADQLKEVDQALSDLRQEVEQFGMTDFEKGLDNFMRKPAADAVSIDMARADLEALRGKQAGQAIKGIQKEVDQFGMTDFQKRLDDLKHNPATLFKPEELAEAQKALSRLEALTKNKELDDKAAAFRESIRTPTEQLNAALDELQDLLAHNKITSAEFDRGAADARQNAFGDPKLTANAFRFGSAEAWANRYDLMRGQQAGKDYAKQQVDQQKQTNGLLGQLLKVSGLVDSGPVLEITA